VAVRMPTHALVIQQTMSVAEVNPLGDRVHDPVILTK
jgi:hypothetical protein